MMGFVLLHSLKSINFAFNYTFKVNMNLQEEKLDVIHQLMQVTDEGLLHAVKNMLDFGLERQGNSQTDFWDELSEAQKVRIEIAIQQLEAGQGIPHEEVMERLRKKYAK